MARSTQRRPVTRIRPGHDAVVRADTLVAEEPLEIRVNGSELAVTMRTPGGDFDLAAGFLLSEGIVSRADDVAAITYRGGELADGSNTYNVVDVTLAPGVPLPDPAAGRAFYTTSSCGICGKASISAVRTVSAHAVAGDGVVLDTSFVSALPDRLREQQALFTTTGGLHAAALVDAATGDVLVVREDVGRHNAVDKVIGWALREGRVPLTGCVLQVSGRVGFELVQKASMAGVPVLSAVSAPSSLAADLAEEIGLTLIGFVRGGSMVVYTRPDRVRHERDGEHDGDGTAPASEAP